MTDYELNYTHFHAMHSSDYFLKILSSSVYYLTINTIRWFLF